MRELQRRLLDLEKQYGSDDFHLTVYFKRGVKMYHGRKGTLDFIVECIKQTMETDNHIRKVYCGEKEADYIRLCRAIVEGTPETAKIKWFVGGGDNSCTD